MADKRTQFTWDPIALAAQLRNIARQSQVLMRQFVSHQPDAIKFGMGHGSTLGFEFFELMTRMMTDPVVVARAQIDLFYNTLVFCPGNSLTKSREFMKDGVGSSGPHEGL